MKRLALISALLICSLCSCKLDKKPDVLEGNEEDTLRIIKPPGKYITDFENKACKLQIDCAKIDVRNGRLVYEDNRGGWVIIRYDDEMEEILNGYGIEYLETGPNCTLEQECYGYYMDSIIRQTFGEAFIKQIEKRADSLFLSSWETKTYASWDIDEAPFYKGEEPETYIKNRIRFSENWDTIPMKDKSQFVTIDIFISNQGELTNWEFDDYYNLKETNEQFLPEIRKQINQILRGMIEWAPGKLMDKDVNSTIWLFIYLDKEG